VSVPIGPDYASVDANNTPNFVAAKSAGARFVIPRAIYGRPVQPGTTAPFRDPSWERDKDRILAAGLKRTAYLFVCYPKKDASGHDVYTPSPEDQAQAFIDYVQLVSYRDYVPMFDVEEASNVLTADEMYDWTLRVARRMRLHYGAWPGMYTSQRVWNENLKNHAPGALINCPLWLAKPWPWAVRTPVHLDGAPSYSPYYIPQWGNQCWLYQYQGDATGWPGFNRTVDASRFQTTKRGAKGSQVKWLQQRLGGLTVDGDFGPKTEAAVKALQTRYGLLADGIVGPDTFGPLCWSNPAPLI
jgi:GH25 family lysozyme M1 (1,4-beta-N-acetylmuramidase)